MPNANQITQAKLLELARFATGRCTCSIELTRRSPQPANPPSDKMFTLMRTFVEQGAANMVGPPPLLTLEGGDARTPCAICSASTTSRCAATIPRAGARGAVRRRAGAGRAPGDPYRPARGSNLSRDAAPGGTGRRARPGNTLSARVEPSALGRQPSWAIDRATTRVKSRVRRAQLVRSLARARRYAPTGVFYRRERQHRILVPHGQRCGVRFPTVRLPWRHI